MSWKRSLLELGIATIALFARHQKSYPVDQPRMFILRNNDLGDVIVITPVFEALKRLFPNSHIVAGIGPWAKDVLKHNPYVDEILILNAPWHNKYTQQALGSNSPKWKQPFQLWKNILWYIFKNPEVQALAQLKCDIGIDIVGSPAGSLLMMKVGIPFKMGVKGYAGGHTACQAYVDYDQMLFVGQQSLKFAQQLGLEDLPPAKPQIFLSDSEKAASALYWKPLLGQKIILAPGAGLAEKKWPIDDWIKLACLISQQTQTQMIVIGSLDDQKWGEAIVGSLPNTSTQNLCGQLNLRQTFALMAMADLVICHSSMVMHAAAAFDRPTLVLLGPIFESAQQHAQQWSISPHAFILGKASAKDRLPTPLEAFEALKTRGWIADGHLNTSTDGPSTTTALNRQTIDLISPNLENE